MGESKQTPELALPWSAVENSWQYTTIYDALDVPVCRFDLEDWGVDEDNQDKLEARQAAVVSTVIRAVNSHDDMLAALKGILSNPGGRCTAEQWQAGLRALARAEGKGA